jgi:hypothetical protein
LKVVARVFVHGAYNMLKSSTVLLVIAGCRDFGKVVLPRWAGPQYGSPSPRNVCLALSSTCVFLDWSKVYVCSVLFVLEDRDVCSLPQECFEITSWFAERSGSATRVRNCATGLICLTSLSVRCLVAYLSIVEDRDSCAP